MSTSITRAAAATEEWTVSQAANRQRTGRSRSAAAACRAATRAERFPAEPPLTKTPPALAGIPAASASHANAWFSAQIAPAPSIQPAAIVEDAPTIRSNSTLAFVGAPGTNANAAGWSVEMVAGASTSPHSRSASSQPMPSDVTVSPARLSSSLADTTLSSGCAAAMRFRA